MIIRNYFLGRRVNLILLAILTIVNLIAINLPLLNNLGFEYSLLNSILLFIIGGIISINSLRKSFFEIRENFYRELVLSIIPFLSISLIIGLIGSILVSSCPFAEGLLFFLIIPVPSVVFGLMLGIVSYWFSKRWTYLIFIVMIFIPVIVSVMEFYFLPMIYSYNLLIGFYPGTIYDEDVSITYTLISYRIFNFTFVLSLFLFVKEKIDCRKNKMLLLVLVIIVQSLFIISKPYLGFSTDKERIINNLPAVIYTEHFEIYTSKKMPDQERKYIALLHEFSYDEIKKIIPITDKRRFTSYVFDSNESRRKIFGSGNADISKPWLREIYLSQGSAEQSVRHELAHGVLAEYGVGLLKVTGDLNPAMLEGFAMALDKNMNEMTIHEFAALAIKNNYQMNAAELFSGFNFFGNYSSLSYLYAGSFIKYLFEKYDRKNILELYSDTNFNLHTGKSLFQLSEDHTEFLSAQKVDANRSKAQLYFGGQTIFKKYCARTTSLDIKKAWNLFETKKHDASLILFKKIYNYSGTVASLLGINANLWKFKKYKESAVLLDREIHKFKYHQSYFRLLLANADNLLVSGNISKAEAHYDFLYDLSPHIEYEIVVLMRKQLLKESADSLSVYLQSNSKKKIEFMKRRIIDKINVLYLEELIDLNDKVTDSFEDGNIKYDFNVTDYISTYTAYKYSLYNLRRNRLELAKLYAVKALSMNAGAKMRLLYSDHLKMVNWFYNFSANSKMKFN